MNAKLDELVRGKRFDEIVLYFSEREKTCSLSPSELVLKGRAIQLGSEAVPLPLAAAEAAFRAALEDDPDYVPALLELGWFLHSVEGDSVRALPFFDRALELGLKFFKEAAGGKRECLQETGAEEALSQFLGDLRRELSIDEV